MDEIKEYLKKYFRRGSHNWHDYESAKDYINQLDLSSMDYAKAIEIIVEYLEV
jgi:hypothetical protein